MRLLISPLILCLLSTILCAGCTTTVSEAALRNAAESTQGDTMGRVYYLGRDHGYDYFQINWNVGSEKLRIAVPNEVVLEPIPYGSDPVQVGPFASDRWLP